MMLRCTIVIGGSAVEHVELVPFLHREAVDASVSPFPRVRL
jgi:hypothetical protein